MSSAALAFSDSRQPARRRGHRAGTQSTATSAAADLAIRRIVDERRRRHKYGSAVGTQASSLDFAIGGISEAVNGSVSRLGLPHWLFRAAVLAVVAAVLAWAVFVRGSIPRYTVDGLLLFEGRPVAQATLTFVLVGDAQAEGRVFRTDQAGAFRTDGEESLPGGLYAVVVQPPRSVGAKAAKKPAIPATYTDPSTTPLRVQVSEDLTGLKLLVRREAPRTNRSFPLD